MDDTHEIIEEYYLSKKRKILIIFNDMIADMLRNKEIFEKQEQNYLLKIES